MDKDIVNLLESLKEDIPPETRELVQAALDAYPKDFLLQCAFADLLKMLQDILNELSDNQYGIINTRPNSSTNQPFS